jgi:hypothetical protein
MTISVKRCGVTARYWAFETDDVSVSARGDETVSLDFSISSKGGGRTRVSVRIDYESFCEIACTMIKVDQDEAIKAFEQATVADTA